MTVKTRISLFIVGTGFIASLLFSVIIFFEMLEQPFELLDSLLKEEAYHTVEMIEGYSEAASGYTSPLTLSLNQYWVKVVDLETDRVCFLSEPAKRIQLPPLEPGLESIESKTIPRDIIHLDQDDSQEVTFRVRAFQIAVNGKTYFVQIARAMEKLEEEIWEMVFGILSGLVFSSLGLIALSRFVASKILRPIGKINDLATVISEKNLDQRIPAGEGQDEFSRLANTINGMLDRLQDSFIQQRELLFDTSHELKTPLTTIRMAVEEILSGSRENLHPAAAENLHRLQEQVLRMDRLVKGLLNLSALEILTEVDTHPIQITPLLSSLSEEYRFLAEAHRITMEIRIPEQLVACGDAEKLRRAFSNILDNAVKYNVEGGRIEVTADQSAAELRVSIANTGPGIPEEELPKLFDQFYRVEKSRSIRYGGSGLGLAMVKKIVELHQGTVQFESRQEGLTRVTIILPKSQKDIPG